MPAIITDPARFDDILLRFECPHVLQTSHWAALKAKLELSGKRLADLDLQIASIALSRDLPLITHNTRHFTRIPSLQLDDWLA